MKRFNLTNQTNNKMKTQTSTAQTDAAPDKVGTKLAELEKAKGNVKYLVDHPESSVDFHGLSYWATVVERLRPEIKSALEKSKHQ